MSLGPPFFVNLAKPFRDHSSVAGPEFIYRAGPYRFIFGQSGVSLKGNETQTKFTAGLNPAARLVAAICRGGMPPYSREI
jgi:hypothetical protein